MAENIDSLQIEISANATVAEKSLNRLADSLLKLQGSLKSINGGQFQNLSSGIRQMSDAMTRFSGGVKTADFTRIATGLNKLSGVNVQGVSDASRAISTLTANLSQIGTISFDSQGIANVANAIAQLGRKTVTQATANIPVLTQSLSSLVTGLNQIGSVSFDISSLSQLVSAITKLGGKSATTAASGNIDKLAVALKNMMTTLSKAPVVSNNLIQMTQALAQLAASGSRAGTATRSLTSSFGAFNVSSGKAAKSAGGLAAAFGKFYATYWLIIRSLGLFKNAIDISSDLTEVQNVVDVTFGHMSDTMNEFADSALKTLGMSELMAKQIASRFQAMGVAMGFSQSKMSEMSIELTKLAGDMASFYNVSQDQIATALQSIFTGETEPLRRFGLDLSFATIEAWALANGLNANMRSMSQAEKTMLRYQYVLANTGAAQGDFLRTINSWHNQLVLLTGAFQQLGSIVGGVLINAFKPFIQALNSVMGAVINFAQVVSDALGAIFGWEYQTGGGVAQDLEAGMGAAQGIEDATGGAAKNAKELNRYIAAWHEVNNMTSNEGSGGGGGGGGGAGGGGSNANGGEWVQSESIWEKYTSDIDSLYELGEYISKVLTKAMDSIDWDSVYEGARNFGTGLASFLNGLISPELFGATGRTIAGALNTVIYAALSFGETFDWYDFGLSIATGINEFFKTYDFSSAAQNINIWLGGLLDALIAGLENLEWGMIGNQIGVYLSEIDWGTLLAKAAKAIVLALSGAFEAYVNLFSVAPLEATIIAGVVGFKYVGLGKQMIKGIQNAFLLALGGETVISLPELALSIGKISLGTGAIGFDAIGSEIIEIINNFIRENFGENLLNAMGEGVLIATAGGIGTVFGGPIGTLIGAAIGIALDTFVVKGEWITGFWKKLGATLFNWDTTSQLLEDAKKYFSQAFKSDNFLEFGKNIVLGIINGIFAALGFVIEPVMDLFNSIGDAICDIFGIHSPAENMKQYGAYILEGIIEGFTDTFGEWTQALDEWFDKYISPWFTKQKWSDLYSTIKDSLKNTWDNTVAQWLNDIQSWWNNSVAPWFTIEKWKTVASGIKDGIKSKWDETVGQWTADIQSWWNSSVVPWFTVEKWQSVAGGIKTGLENAFNNAISGLKNIWNNFASWLNSKLSFTIPPISIMGQTLYGGGTVQLGKLPTFAKGGVVNSPTLGIFGESGREAIMPLENNTGWITTLANDITSRMGNVKIDIMPDVSKYQFKPASINPDKVLGQVREALDYTFASGGFIDYDRLGQAVYEAQSQAMQENPVQIGDNDIYSATRRAQSREFKRTGKIGWAGI